jgi:hypothetical protein
VIDQLQLELDKLTSKQLDRILKHMNLWGALASSHQISNWSEYSVS